MTVLACIIAATLGFVTGLTVAVYQYPQREIGRLYRIFVRAGLRHGEWKHFSELIDHNTKLVVKPNCETLYSTTFIDLRKSDYLLSIPPIDSYFSICFINHKTDVQGYVTNADVQTDSSTQFILTSNPRSTERQIFLEQGKHWIIARFGILDQRAQLMIKDLQHKLVLTEQDQPKTGGTTYD